MSDLRLIVADAAQRDIDNIGRFIAQDSFVAARRFVDHLTSYFERLGEMPGIGSQRDDLELGLRGRSIGNYVIYYRVIDDNLLIQRVIHSARHQPSAFSDINDPPQ